MVYAAQLVHKHCRRFGLLMHIGRNSKNSKTEAIHFPKRINKSPIPPGTKVMMQDDDLPNELSIWEEGWLMEKELWITYGRHFF
jgi:hypothetical protein